MSLLLSYFTWESREEPRHPFQFLQDFGVFSDENSGGESQAQMETREQFTFVSRSQQASLMCESHEH